MEKHIHNKERLRSKRLQRIRRKRIMRAVLVCSVLIGAGTIFLCSIKFAGWAGKKINAYQQRKTGKKTNELFQAEKIEIKNQHKTREVTLKAPAQDRSDFAISPDKRAGVSEENQEKTVYLTFDDGPSENTQAVMDILDRYQAKATFFVTGAQPEYAHMIKKAYDKGHTIGLHTFSHDYASVYASTDAYFKDLDAIGQVVKEQIGYIPCFIRFPGGSSNSVSVNYTQGIMTILSQEVLQRGYQYYDWNGSSGDGSVKTKEQLIAQGTSYTSPNIVFLSHDSQSKQTTVEALPAIIEHYQSQGYVFRALDRESYAPHHGISN